MDTRVPTYNAFFFFYRNVLVIYLFPNNIKEEQILHISLNKIKHVTKQPVDRALHLAETK